MKKILTLLVFIFIAFFASGQTDLDGVRKDWSDIRFIINENFDTIYSRVDSLDLIVVSDSVKAVVELTVRDTTIIDLIKEHGVGVSFGNEFELPIINATSDDFNYSSGLTYNDSLNVSGNIIGDTIKANVIGIGVSHPADLIHAYPKNIDSGSKGISIQSGDASAGIGVMSLKFIHNNGSILSYINQKYSSPFTMTWKNTQEADLSMESLSNIICDIDADNDAGNRYFKITSKGKTKDLLIVEEEGNVGLSISSPLSLLHVNGGLGDIATGISLNDGLSGMHQSVLGELNFTVDNIEAMRLTADTVFVDSTARFGKDLIVDGNIGVGTVIPIAKVEIVENGDFSASVPIAGTGLMIRSDIDGNDATLRIGTDNANLKAVIQTQQTTTGLKFPLCLNPFGGLIGINEISPLYNLDVDGTGRFTGIVNFDVFPITPSSAPTTDYQVANRKFVLDNTVTFGTDNQTPFMNVGGTDFEYSANYTFNGVGLMLGSSATNSTFVGINGGEDLTSGIGNSCFGRDAGANLTEGVANVFFGFQAGINTTTGDNNVYLGTAAGKGNATGSSNVFIGDDSGLSSTSSNRLIIENSSDITTPLIDGDFSANEVTINDVLLLNPLSSAPSTTTLGAIYVNSTDNHIYFYNGSTWVQMDN